MPYRVQMKGGDWWGGNSLSKLRISCVGWKTTACDSGIFRIKKKKERAKKRSLFKRDGRQKFAKD